MYFIPPFRAIRFSHSQPRTSSHQKQTKKSWPNTTMTWFMLRHFIWCLTCPKHRLQSSWWNKRLNHLATESYAQNLVATQENSRYWYSKIRFWEQHYWDIADRLIVMSEEDKQAITQHVKQPEKIAVVANGVDIAWFGQVKKRKHTNPPFFCGHLQVVA